MKIGVIGPPGSITEIKETLEGSNTPVEPVLLPYKKYTDVVDILNRYQDELDGVLFSGSTSYRYASGFVHATKPWEYLPQRKLSLVSTLLKAMAIEGWDIRRASLDSYSTELIYDAYKEVGYSADQLAIQLAHFDLFEPEYIERLYQFHRNSHQSGKTACCITGIEVVQSRLRADGIPCIMISNSSDVIVQYVNKMSLDLQIKVQDDNKIAIVVIEIHYIEDLSNTGQNALQVFCHKNRVVAEIYLYAERLGAAVIAEGDCYYLLSTKAVIQSDTNGFQHLTLLNELALCDLVQNVFIGIGLGNNALQSKYNATIGCHKARKTGKNSLYIIQENQQIIGPVLEDGKRDIGKDVNDIVYHISSQIGIGINTLVKLDRILCQNNLEATTTQTLASLYGISQRSMNRILHKLEESGYLTVVGKESRAVPGRPSRLLHIDLSKYRGNSTKDKRSMDVQRLDDFCP